VHNNLQSGAQQRKQYRFDRCLSGEAKQNDVYNAVDMPSMLAHAIQGFPAMIFAFGATGAGKTHTLLGSDKICISERNVGLSSRLGSRESFTLPGSPVPMSELAPCQRGAHVSRGCGVTPILPSSPSSSQALHQLPFMQHAGSEMTAEPGLLFQAVQHAFLLVTKVPNRLVEVAITVAEVYQERVADLLAGSVIRPVKQHPQHGFYADGLRREVCNSFADAQRVLQAALRHRCVILSKSASAPYSSCV
jgi:hypothetical protein